MKLRPIESIEEQDPKFKTLRQYTNQIYAAWAVICAVVFVMFEGVGILLALLSLGFLLAHTALSLYHRLQAEQLQHYWQLEAVASLMAIVKPRLPLPAMRLWAASPDFLVIVLRLIRQHQPQTIVELGSGVSSLISGYALEQNGSGQLISLDHETAFAQVTRDNLHAHGLNQWVTVHDAPLRPLQLNGQPYQWYDTAVLEQLPPIDLLIVDGPPATLGIGARFPAVPMLYERLNAGAFILIDDAKRDADYQNAVAWLQAYPLELVQSHANEKGAILLRKPITTALEAP